MTSANFFHAQPPQLGLRTPIGRTRPRAVSNVVVLLQKTMICSIVEPDEILRIYYWFLDGSRNPSSVKIKARNVVEDLRKAISRSEHKFITLWKVGSFQAICVLLACIIAAADAICPAQ